MGGGCGTNQFGSKGKIKKTTKGQKNRKRRRKNKRKK
jgi:hypothetical protein